MGLMSLIPGAIDSPIGILDLAVAVHGKNITAAVTAFGDARKSFYAAPPIPSLRIATLSAAVATSFTMF